MTVPGNENPKPKAKIGNDRVVDLHHWYDKNELYVADSAEFQHRRWYSISSVSITLFVAVYRIFLTIFPTWLSSGSDAGYWTGWNPGIGMVECSD